MIAALVVVALLSSAPQTPPPQADRPQAPAAATTAPEMTDEAEDNRLNERVCRTEAIVGTRFGSRICMTRREWNQRRDDSRRLAQRLESANSRRDSAPLATTTGR